MNAIAFVFLMFAAASVNPIYETVGVYLIAIGLVIGQLIIWSTISFVIAGLLKLTVFRRAYFGILYWGVFFGALLILMLWNFI
jgi:hypothetical protein